LISLVELGLPEPANITESGQELIVDYGDVTLTPAQEDKLVELMRTRPLLRGQFSKFTSETEPAQGWKVLMYWAKIKAFDAGTQKPLTVERTYKGTTHTIDCYVTTQIRDEHQTGTLTIGDYVIISFIDGDPEKACAILKVHKTW
jgi:hypothetical protein